MVPRVTVPIIWTHSFHAQFIAMYLKWLALLISCGLLTYLTVSGPPSPLAEDVFLPELPIRPTFHLDNQSYIPFDEEADRFWEDLTPPNHGAVLATNLTSGFHYWARLSMFHHLSCLRDIRKAFILISPDWAAAEDFVRDQTEVSHYSHIGRCFDYIRQGLFCHADATLHPIAHLKGHGGDIIDGNALWSSCRDSSFLYDWALRSGHPSKSWLIHEQREGD